MASKLFRSLKSKLAGHKAPSKSSPEPLSHEIEPGTIICSLSSSSALILSTPQDSDTLPELSVKPLSNAQYDKIKGNTLESDISQIAQVYILVSTLSGNQQAASFRERILHDVLQRFNFPDHKFKIIHTKDSNTVSNVTRDTILPLANNGIKQLIILLSGDGGIVDILNALSPRSETYLAPQISLIPMGTGNALANSTGLTDPTFGLSTLLRGQPKSLPMFKTTFSSGSRLLVNEGHDEIQLPTSADSSTSTLYGAVVCSWGMHAGLVADSDTTEFRKFGVDRFKMAANEALHPSDGSAPHAYHAKVSFKLRGATEWTDVPRSEHAYVLTTLVSDLEKGFTISPASSPLDGKMRLVHFGTMSGDEIMGLMGQAYQGGLHVKEPSVSYEEVDIVKISFEGGEEEGRWRRICVDGKIIRVDAGGWVEIQKEEQSIVSLRYLAK